VKTLNRIFNFILAGVATALITACSSAEPHIIVVTATPTATALVVTATPNPVVSTPEPTPIVELSVKSEDAPTKMAPAYEAGTVLKGNGDDIFYLTEDGARQRFYDRGTFLAFGFAEDDIVAVDDEVLAAIPLSGKLTRLAMDEADNLYWVAQGQRWRVNEWKQVGTADYTSLVSAPWDSSLWKTLPVQAGFKQGTLLRAGNAVYYFDQGTIVPLTAQVDKAVEVIDIPVQMLTAYEQKTHLDQAQVRLNSGTPAANVRQGPSLEAEVLGAVENRANLIVKGRTADKAWLQIDYQGQSGWVAADLVEQSVALSLLPTISEVSAEHDLPEAEPAAVVEASAPQPFYCTDVPIRGFGKVWGEHPEVQAMLGCPDSWQGGEQGTRAAVQIFQNGLMVWLEADGFYSGDPIWVFFSDGTYQRFGELGPADPVKVGVVPAGFYEVGDKFGKVYWEGTGAQVKERLGYAIRPATDSAGAFQSFSNGRMFWTEVIDRIFVVYEYGYFDENNTYIQVRTWHSYEDTF
jgi:hypothetical protein